MGQAQPEPNADTAAGPFDAEVGAGVRQSFRRRPAASGERTLVVCGDRDASPCGLSSTSSTPPPPLVVATCEAIPGRTATRSVPYLYCTMNIALR